MRISDWSSDVCSSDLRVWDQDSAPLPAQHERYFDQSPDLHRLPAADRRRPAPFPYRAQRRFVEALKAAALRDGNRGDRTVEIEGQREHNNALLMVAPEIGRASGRERVCQYVEIRVVAGSVKKK